MRHRSFLESLRSGDYESYAIELFAGALEPGAVVVDGGAHIGFFTLMTLRREPAVGRVHAFEPDPFNHAALAANVGRAGGGRVTLHRKALAAERGRARLSVSSGTISTSLFARGSGSGWEAVEVDVTTVDDELGQIDAALVCKLDLEGAEPLALGGMARSAAAAARVSMLVEVNPAALAAAGSSAASLVEAIATLGLSLAFIDERARELRPVDDPAQLEKGNLWCWKEPAG
jgi:FkbM family methyltransferase